MVRESIVPVERGAECFLEDTIFQVTVRGFEALKSQIVISCWGGRRTAPYAFTEQGVAMLSGARRSERAVLVNIDIMHAFVRLRGMLAENAELSHKLSALERRYDEQFKIVFDAMRALMNAEKKPRRTVGFVQEGER